MVFLYMAPGENSRTRGHAGGAPILEAAPPPAAGNALEFAGAAQALHLLVEARHDGLSTRGTTGYHEELRMLLHRRLQAIDERGGRAEVALAEILLHAAVDQHEVDVTGHQLAQVLQII